MNDMLDGAAEMVAETLREDLARPVVYRRGPLSAAIPATVGQSEMDVFDEAGTAVRIAVRDYLVTAADLVLGGKAVEPRRGDRIEDEQDGTFEVLSPGMGEPDWRWMAGRRMFRIHVKEIS
jgi:hypothetical protein